MDIRAYLRRIKSNEPLAADYRTLRALHHAHMLAIPFENLSIHWGESIVLDEPRLYQKIVTHRRGGFCYELNGLFSWLLRQSGFDVTRLAAGVARADGDFGPDFDHMALLVELDRPYLADVGFGDSFVEPLFMDTDQEQIDADGRSYRIVCDQEVYFMQQKDLSGRWQSQYRFTLTPHELFAYGPMCHYQQTSPESSFTRKRVCSLATLTGRLTLSDLRLIETSNGNRTERELQNEAEFDTLLYELFGIRRYVRE